MAVRVCVKRECLMDASLLRKVKKKVKGGNGDWLRPCVCCEECECDWQVLAWFS